MNVFMGGADAGAGAPEGACAEAVAAANASVAKTREGTRIGFLLYLCWRLVLVDADRFLFFELICSCSS
jgi:hypothetical protein